MQRRRDRKGLTYLGLAPVFPDSETGRLRFKRSQLRYAPEFGERRRVRETERETEGCEVRNRRTGGFTTATTQSVFAAVIPPGATVIVTQASTAVPQFQFDLSDCTAVSTPASGALWGVNVTGTVRVTQIVAGDRMIWNDPVGVDVSTFAPGSSMRGVVMGHCASPSQQITVTLAVTFVSVDPGPQAVAGTVSFSFFGRKPLRHGC